MEIYYETCSRLHPPVRHTVEDVFPTIVKIYCSVRFSQHWEHEHRVQPRLLCEAFLARCICHSLELFVEPVHKFEMPSFGERSWQRMSDSQLTFSFNFLIASFMLVEVLSTLSGRSFVVRFVSLLILAKSREGLVLL